MKSTSGAHYIALDHVRALAAFMVFAWHFTHTTNGVPIPFHFVPKIFPLALLDEGHTGVALFMTLSGYLFAKLLDGKSIDFPAFLWNRALRLLPLLVVVIILAGLQRWIVDGTIHGYPYTIAVGWLQPTLPNGGWSITVEFHFYVVLPVLLWLLRRSPLLLGFVLLFAIGLRTFLYLEDGQVQALAYFTIIGRIDQFLLGMLGFHLRSRIIQRGPAVVGALTAFAGFYWYFDQRGGYYEFPAYPSPSPLWIVLPSIEGLAYAIGIAWYDGSFTHSMSGLSRFISRIGEYSYSIYLLHFFVVFRLADLIHKRIIDLSNFYLACLMAVPSFLLMMPFAYLSFRWIEGPFLTLRRPYVKTAAKSASKGA